MFMSERVRCPFYKLSRMHFTVPFCDNLVSGVPHCIVWDCYPDLDPFTDFSDVRDYDLYMDVMQDMICSHFVRSDVYLDRSLHSGCFFGGKCFNPEVRGYSACTVDCVRFKG